MKGYIYKYTFSNGKVYIGQTRVSVRERHYQHMSASRDPNRWTPCEMAIAKYGEPECDTIETIEVDDHENLKLSNLLDEAERKWIKHYDSTIVNGKGYNVQLGGKICPPHDFILQEKWYEIFEKEKWGESIAYVQYLLESIGTKLCITKEKLTKEERAIWFGYKFHEHESGIETTFSSFYSRNIDFYSSNIGNVPYDLLEIVNDEKSSDEEKMQANLTLNKCFFDITLKAAVEEHWIEDIRQTIWRKVMKHKEQILRDFYKSVRKD